MLEDITRDCNWYAARLKRSGQPNSDSGHRFRCQISKDLSQKSPMLWMKSTQMELLCSPIVTESILVPKASIPSSMNSTGGRLLFLSIQLHRVCQWVPLQFLCQSVQVRCLNFFSIRRGQSSSYSSRERLVGVLTSNSLFLMLEAPYRL